MSPERVRDYWCILTPQLEQLSADADELGVLDPDELLMLATSLRAIAKQFEQLATCMPGAIGLRGKHAEIIDEAA